MIGYDIRQYDIVWNEAIQHNVMLFEIWYNITKSNIKWYSIIWYDLIWYRAWSQTCIYMYE